MLNLLMIIWFISLIIYLLRYLIHKLKQLKTIEVTGNTDYEPIKTIKDYKLSKEVEQVMELYELSGIQLPLDIIELLGQQYLINELQLYDFNSIYKFIENQRYYWKLENSKKPYK